MRNQYPGTCYRCEGIVPAGEGYFERTPFSKGWRVQHTGCATQFRGTDVGKQGESEKRNHFRINRLNHKAQGTGKAAQRARATLRREGHSNAPT